MVLWHDGDRVHLPNEDTGVRCGLVAEGLEGVDRRWDQISPTVRCPLCDLILSDAIGDQVLFNPD